MSDGDGFLYVLNSRSGSINAFSIDPADGSLTPLDGVAGFPAGGAGLVAT